MFHVIIPSVYCPQIVFVGSIATFWGSIQDPGCNTWYQLQSLFANISFVSVSLCLPSFLLNRFGHNLIRIKLYFWIGIISWREKFEPSIKGVTDPHCSARAKFKCLGVLLGELLAFKLSRRLSLIQSESRQPPSAFSRVNCYRLDTRQGDRNFGNIKKLTENNKRPGDS